MAVIALTGATPGRPGTVNLCTTLTGNGQSTNVADRGVFGGPALLKLTSTVGSTPTVTVAVEGSADGTNFFNIPYADSATPTTVAVTNLTITTATTSWKYLITDFPWRYVRLTLSANTNVTLTADVYA